VAFNGVGDADDAGFGNGGAGEDGLFDGALGRQYNVLCYLEGVAYQY